MPDENLKGVSVVWHGLPVGMHGLKPRDIVIEVQRDKPLTPKLGWTRIHQDEKAEAFALFVRETLAAYYCRKDRGAFPEAGRVRQGRARACLHMRMAAEVCTQEELDRLQVFYCKQVDRHFPRDAGRRLYGYLRSRAAGGDLVNERLHLLIDGKTVWEEDDELASGPILPEGTLQGAELPERRPSWLQVEDKVIEVRVTPKDASPRQFAWHQADIESDREIEAIAVFSEDHDGERLLQGFTRCLQNNRGGGIPGLSLQLGRRHLRYPAARTGKWSTSRSREYPESTIWRISLRD